MALSVLIVDDEAAMCDSLAAYFEDEGIQVHTSDSGEDALRRVVAGLPAQVCIMDLRLPGMNGSQAILAIHEHVPGMRFIIHTGSAHDTILEDLRRRGLDDIPVFRKPVDDMAALVGCVRTLGADAANAAG